jgi:hypothetical protein
MIMQIKNVKEYFQPGQMHNWKTRDLIKIETALRDIINEQNPVQIKRFERYSENYLKENYKLEDFIIKEKNYVRRYLVIKNSQGQKEIYVSLICDDIAREFDWKTHVSDGYGGGSCVFSFKLNITTNK